jgi:V/A-type H+-transporting ATPase subunit F
MKMYLISDNVDTHTGMRLAGVPGCVLHTRQELQDALARVLTDPEIGILLLTEKFSRDFPDVVNAFKLAHSMPLVVEIPDRHGTGRKPDFITAYAGEAIGLKL